MNIKYAAIAALAVLLSASLTAAKTKDTNPSDYPLTAAVLSVTAPNTESAVGGASDSHGNTSTAHLYSSTAARAEIQIGSTIYLVGLPHECGTCIHRKSINLTAGETLHARFTKDNRGIEILKANNGTAVVENFIVRGSRVAKTE